MATNGINPDSRTRRVGRDPADWERARTVTARLLLTVYAVMLAPSLASAQGQKP